MMNTHTAYTVTPPKPKSATCSDSTSTANDSAMNSRSTILWASPSRILEDETSLLMTAAAKPLTKSNSIMNAAPAIAQTCCSVNV